MNIFKKIKLANELIKIYTEVKAVLESTHLTENVKNNVQAIKLALENIKKDIPIVNRLIEIVFKK